MRSRILDRIDRIDRMGKGVLDRIYRIFRMGKGRAVVGSYPVDPVDPV
jgi:hypothetical protein